MNEFTWRDTLQLVACDACGGRMLEHDRFCRTCGVPQSIQSREEHCGMRSMPDLYHPVSGPFITALARQLAANCSVRVHSRSLKAVVTVVVSVPLWLIILLLSPLDAYVTARSITRAIY